MKSSIFAGILTFILLVFLNSCSSDSGSNTLSVTTFPANIDLGSFVTLGGNISNNGGSTIVSRGVCWGISDNPIKGSANFVEDGYNLTGGFTFQVTTLSPNTLYYARAFCENGDGIQYGNTITFTTGQFVATEKATDISTTKATLTGQKTFTGLGQVGFVYSTSHNPTTANNKVFISLDVNGLYQIDIDELTPNTTYYFRAYLEGNEAEYTYGVEQEFKTAGYFGTGGGYVAFDKGEVTEGWRYLEVYPTTLSYNIVATTGSAWGTANQFVSGTVDNIGAGPSNTTAIVSTVSQPNCAAKLCDNLVLNGKSDWFLGSSQEMLLVTRSMYDAGTVIGSGSNIWTSTQDNASDAKTIHIESLTDTVSITSLPKSFTNLNVLPMRRY